MDVKKTMERIEQYKRMPTLETVNDIMVDIVNETVQKIKDRKASNTFMVNEILDEQNAQWKTIARATGLKPSAFEELLKLNMHEVWLHWLGDRRPKV